MIKQCKEYRYFYLIFDSHCLSSSRCYKLWLSETDTLQLKKKQCYEVRAARAARLFSLIEPIVCLIFALSLRRLSKAKQSMFSQRQCKFCFTLSILESICRWLRGLVFLRVLSKFMSIKCQADWGAGSGARLTN